MATTQEFYSTNRTANMSSDPRYFPTFMMNDLKIPYSSQYQSQPMDQSGTQFWSNYQRIGYYLSSSSGGWVTLIDISSSTKPIALAHVFGPRCSTHTGYIRITVDGTAYQLQSPTSFYGAWCWGAGFDHFTYVYGGSSQYGGASKRGGSDLYNTSGNVYNYGTDAISQTAPMGVAETMCLGLPVLVAEHSLKVETYGTPLSSWPYQSRIRGCGYSYLNISS